MTIRAALGQFASVTRLVLVLAVLVSPAAGAFELATWNIKHLGWEDGRDWTATVRVIEGYEFVALQEVMEPAAVRQLEASLEAHTGAQWSSLISSRAVGRSRYTEHYAFLWQTADVRYEGGAVVYLDPGDVFEREPFAARFSSRDGRWRWTAATVHAIYGDSADEREREARALDDYVAWLEANVAQGTPVVLMGDFNLTPDNSAFRQLRADYQPVIERGATTLSSYDGRYANLYDQIYIHTQGLPIQSAWIDRYPRRLRLTHIEARRRVSDHAPIVISLTRSSPPSGAPAPALDSVAGASSGDAALRVACAHPDAAGDDRHNLADEYVVLKNAEDAPLDLAGWTLRDAAGHELPLVGHLPGKQEVRVTAIDFGRPVWNNSGDTVVLLPPNGARSWTGQYPGTIPLCR